MLHYRYVFIKTVAKVIKICNRDVVSVVVVNSAIQCVVSWLCRISKISCKYWYVMKEHKD